MTVFVVDASTVLASAVEDERTPPAMDVLASLRAADQARVPALW